MTLELVPTEKEDREMDWNHHGGSSEAVYGLGLIGAWVYYIGRAATFRERVIGFFKGLFWPAFLVYDLLVFLHKE
jgi:hypothetical protein